MLNERIWAQLEQANNDVSAIQNDESKCRNYFEVTRSMYEILEDSKILEIPNEIVSYFHSGTHYDSIKVATHVKHKCYHYIYQKTIENIKNDISKQQLEQLINALMVFSSQSEIKRSEFFNIDNYTKGQSRYQKYCIISKKVISFSPLVYSYKAVDYIFKKANTYTLLYGNINLNINCAYEFEYHEYINSHNFVMNWINKSTSLSSEYYNHVLKENISKVAPELHSLFSNFININEIHYSDNFFDELSSYFGNASLRSKSQWINRKKLILGSIISREQKIYDNIISTIAPTKYYPFTLDSMIKNFPVTTLSTRVRVKMNESFAKKGLLSKHAFSFLKLKTVLDSASSYYINTIDNDWIWEEHDDIEAEYRSIKVGEKISNYYYHMINTHFNSVIDHKVLFTDQKDFKINSNAEVLSSLKSCHYIGIKGPAGHGKSKMLIDLIKENDSYNTIIVTPTKKAHEVFNDVDIKIPKITIQKVSTFINNLNQVKELSKKYLPDKCIIVFDEISMYSDKEILAMSLWIKKIMNYNESKNVRFIFVGDDMQLPPITNPQRATHIFNTLNIKNKLIDLSSGQNYRIDKSITSLMQNTKKNYPQIHKLELLKKLQKLIRNRKDISINSGEYGIFLNIYEKYDDMINMLKKFTTEDYTFLVKCNKGIVGAQDLNKILFSKQNDPNIPPYNDGDRVVISANFYDDVINKTSTNYQDYLHAGRVLTITSAKMIFENKVKYILKCERGLNFEYECNKGDESFSHQKILTVHKSQGSTIPKVAVILDEPIVDRRWLYTAVSRTSFDLEIIAPFGFKWEFVDEIDYETE